MLHVVRSASLPLALAALALVAPAATGSQAGGDSSPPVPVDAISADDIEKLPRNRWSTLDAFRAPPVFVTATRNADDLFNLPYLGDSIDQQRITQRGYRTLPQALRDTPGVMVQETSFGQGSPFIRGFTGFRTLLMVDGIRINNSTWREGPNEYFNTVDPFSLNRIEIIKGPASVLYGSDAVGGAVNAITADPYGYNESGSGWGVGGRTYIRGATAEHAILGRGELSAGFDDHTGVLAGITAKSFGDVYAGGDVGNQEQTGYDELDNDFKVEHFINPDTRLVALYQRVDQNNVPRTHTTNHAESFYGTTIGSENQRDTDQERELLYLQLHAVNIDSFIDEAHASISYQRVSEDRHRIRPPSGGGKRVDYQGFDNDIFGASAQLVSDLEWVKLTYGFEFYHENVNSYSSGSDIQGPIADDATYDNLGVYLQGEFPLFEDRLSLIVGGRFNYIAADLGSVGDPDTGDEFSIDDDWTALVGSAQLVWAVIPENLNLFGGVSQGFRAPNLSDLSRFDTARSGEFEIPSPSLDPEYFIQYQVGAKVKNDAFNFEVGYYYTDINDQISRYPNGDLTGGGDTIIVKDNVGDGYIQGIEAGAAYRILPELTVFGNIAWQDGEISNYGTAGGPLEDEYVSRLLPLTSQIGLRYDAANLPVWIETVVVMAAKADHLSSGDMGDTQRIPPGGTPGYTVWNIRAGWRVNDHFDLMVAVDNVTNQDYRIHGSGTNMPGTNFIIGGEFRF